MKQAAGACARGRALAAVIVSLWAETLAGCAGTPERIERRPPGQPPSASPRSQPSVRTQPDAPARTHLVRQGETLWRISRAYGAEPEAVARANAIRDPTELRAGQRLLIPASAKLQGDEPRLASASPSVWNGVRSRGRIQESNRFAWPVDGQLSSGFGLRGGAHHAGLDILAARGTHVRAAEAGRVVHADSRLEGYGNMIILKHSGRFSTVYAHNQRNLVRMGAFVEKGQVIAEVGASGRATTPHLHFELRRDGSPIDPLHYLP